jgi:hypothetical protein
VADLETGMLVTAEADESTGVNMPTHILAPDRLKRIVFDTWASVEPSGQDGDI